MAILPLYEQIKQIFQNTEFLSVEGEFLTGKIFEAIEKLDKTFITILLQNKMTKEHFFEVIEDAYILNQNKLFDFFNAKEYFNSSFTSYTNKIGLIKKDSFIKKFDDVVLAFPYKDCVLEGGMSSEDVAKKEVFYNSIISKEEIDRLFEPKVLTNIKKFDKNGQSTPSEISMNDNLIMKGNNLLALHSLKQRYAGQIKLIYIDPPYFFQKKKQNDSFVYNSNFKLSTWLTFMKNRLEIAKILMRDDGVIFISIDDDGQGYLKVLLDEIFSADNFIANLPTIMNLKGNNDEFGFAGTHEYTLVYAKNKNTCKLYEFNVSDEEMDDWEEDEIGFFKKGANLKSTGVNASREKRPYLYFPILIKDSSVFHITDDEYSQIFNKENKSFNDIFIAELKHKYESEGYIFQLPTTNNEPMTWRWQRNKMIKDAYDIILTEENIYKKQRPSLGELPSKKPKTIFYKPTYSSGNGTKEIKDLFGEKVFSNPKPLELIKDFIQIGASNNDIILDFHAGSGTTAHAVLELNKEDGGNRTFILVEQMDYIETITSERVKKVIEKNNEGSFIYAELKTIETFNEEDTIGRLNDNMRYLPIGEIDDESYVINETEKKLNKQFYGVK